MPDQLNLLDYSEARRKAELGMTRAAEHADSVRPDWSLDALARLQRYAVEHAGQFTAEEAREELHKAGLPLPPDGRAWGSVFKRAASRGFIIKVGYAPRRCGNMTPTIVWAAA